MKKLLITTFFLFGLAFLASPSESNAQTACATPPTDTGTVTMSVDLQGGTYKVWSRMKAADSTNNSFYLEIDGCAKLVGDSSNISSSSWTWVDYINGNSSSKYTVNLAPGTYTVRLIGNEDGVGVDRLLMTQDLTCVPTGLTGDNCVAETPDGDAPVITGVRAYDITGTTAKVTWQLDEFASGQVDYRAVGTSTWQQTGFQTCCQYDMHIQSISGLTNGTTYEYRVRSADASGNESTSQVCRFTAGGAAEQVCASATPTNTPTNSPTQTPTPTGVPDTTPPVISNPRVEDVTATTARFRWELDEFATGKTEYRPLGASTWTVGGNETSFKYDYHIQYLTGFTNGTTYEYRITSADASGNVAVSEICTFTAGGATTQACNEAPTATSTPTPTGTPTPTITNTPTPSPVPNATILNFPTIKLHGIGTGGDNTNPNLGGNPNPLRTTRDITVELLDAGGTTLPAVNGQITFNSGSGVFSGTVELPTSVESGSYLVKVKSPQYLKKQATGIINITKSQSNNIPEISLTTGDIDNDNALTIQDYNILIDCYSDLLPPKNCSDNTKKLSADISDDGEVNANDYNLFLRELSVASGD